MPVSTKKKLTPVEQKKFKQILQSKRRVQAVLGAIDIGIANKLLGGSTSAARQRRAADTKKELYTTSGAFKGFKDTLRRRYKKVARPK